MLVSGWRFWTFEAHSFNALIISFEQVFAFWKREKKNTKDLVWHLCVFVSLLAGCLDILKLCTLWITDILQYHILLSLLLLLLDKLHWARAYLFASVYYSFPLLFSFEHDFFCYSRIKLFVCSQNYFVGMLA